MGTRADFYVGCGPNAEWLGSIAWDGYQFAEHPDEHELMQAKSEPQFRQAVSDLLHSTEDSTTPEQGWPWPWKTSATTDYVYWFMDGHVRWATFDNAHDWPDMSAKANVTLGPRSGLIIVARKKK
jgi:hypothetical protein